MGVRGGVWSWFSRLWPRGRDVNAAAGAIACVACAGVAAMALHAADGRDEAAIVVPIAWVWGVMALATGWLVRDRALPLAVVVIAALAVRLPLVGVPPHLSDDAWRYLWEGLVLAQGGNPFVTAPADLPGLDDALRARVNHPEVTSIYPPVALLWFRLLHAIGGTLAGAQGLAALADVGIAAVLASARERRWPALIYALHPLPAIEAAAGAHLEAPAVLCCAVACLLHARGNPRGAGLVSVLAAGTKLFPVLLIPALLRERRAAQGVAIGTIAIVVLAMPVLTAGPDLLTGFQTYNAHWSFNGFAWTLVRPWLGEMTRPALLLAGAIAVGVALVRQRDPVRVWAAAGTAFVLLSPTAHPWYALWALVPALWLGRWGWAVASVALVGSYAVLLGFDPAAGTWTEPEWLWAITWGPATLALSAEVLRSWWASRNDPSPTAA